jgi:myb proto-oncogene protein
MGRWTADEDSKLKDAVLTHGGMNWAAITSLVPGRTRIQCNDRWNKYLDPSIDWTTRRTGKWTPVEDSKLKDAVETHGDQNWYVIAALIPGRTKLQCRTRWQNAFDPSIGGASGRTGTWTAIDAAS